MEPNQTTTRDIETQTNPQLRRILLERFGQEKYLLSSGADAIHRDDYGVLFRKELRGDEPLVMVKVVNATPEPVAPSKITFSVCLPMRTAHEAVAWTFGNATEDYRPTYET